MSTEQINQTVDQVAPANSLKRRKKHKSIEALKSTYGRMFVLHWEIGLLVFFLVPIFKSLYFSFCDISFSGGEFQYDFVGLKNYNYAINENPNFTNNMSATLGAMAPSVLVIVILSLILALLLNQKFKGRLFFRMLYFVPVIVASGVVIQHVFASTGSELSSSGVSDSFASDMVQVDDIMAWLSLPAEIGQFFSNILNDIFNLIWNCGIQIVLFISGMQSIPDSLYEVSKVEGATKWEEFWFITLPMLARTLILVIIFTMVEIITDKTNSVMTLAYNFMTNISNYGTASAMLWAYFVVVGVIMGVVMVLYSAIFLKRWDTGGRS